jgi:fermentation-respiration switch protein FrsA (DUF1100 family)
VLFESRFIFHPIRADREWLPPPNELVQDIELRTADASIHAWWCPTPDWQPEHGAVLYCHGNAGNLSHRGTGITRWQDHFHQAVLIFDYPGYGRSTGRPGESGCYAAAGACYSWLLETKSIGPEHIRLYGGSLGGAVAVELASRERYRSMVLVSTFTSIPDMAKVHYSWAPARLIRTRFDNLAKIALCNRPLFMAHGTADRVIPFSQGQRLFEAAKDPKQFFAMEGYDHQNAPGPEFYRALKEFLGRSEC